MNTTGSLTIVAAILLIVVTLSAAVYGPQTDQISQIEVKWPNIRSLSELAESSKIIIYGVVESVKTTNSSVGTPTTTFEIRTAKIEKLSRDGTPITVMVEQIGLRNKVEAKGDPLMRIGEEYVLFLSGGEGNVFGPYTASGPYGRFQVAGGIVHPVDSSWSQYNGMTLNEFMSAIDDALGVKVVYKALWEGSPLISNETFKGFLPESKYPAPVWLIETWSGKIALHFDELELKGVRLWMVGYGGDGRIMVGMDKVTPENVAIFLDVLKGEVPPGILTIAKGYPIQLR